MFTKISFALVALAASANCLVLPKELFAGTGEIWALVVAGSNGWGNYRHQADACHAYHVLHNHGVPDDHIVTMMYDDIANSPMNPTKGKIINEPNGTNVYEGVIKDYTGKEVTPANFLKILQGEDMTGVGSGKTIRSGPNDRVFVYFTDHGATGLIAFPYSELYVKELSSALKAMHTAKKYSQLVFYLETCESGSMFANVLPDNMNVYAMTASSPDESSWGCYCENPEGLPCLGDLFSVVWMQDSDKEDLNKETLQVQFDIVKKLTNKSHVQEYGDLSIQKETVGLFQGSEKAPSRVRSRTQHPISAVDSREIPIWTLKRKLEKATSEEEREQIKKEINWLRQKRAYVDHVVQMIVHEFVPVTSPLGQLITTRKPGHVADMDCHMQVAKAFSAKCFSFARNNYAMRHSSVLANMCDAGLSAKDIVETIMRVCDGLVDKPVDVQ